MGREARLPRNGATALADLTQEPAWEWRKAVGYYRMVDGSLRRIIAKPPSRRDLRRAIVRMRAAAY